jgi:lipoprotein NlpI
MGEYDKAMSCFIRVLHIDPDYEDAKLNMQRMMKGRASGKDQDF